MVYYGLLVYYKLPGVLLLLTQHTRLRLFLVPPLCSSVFLFGPTQIKPWFRHNVNLVVSVVHRMRCVRVGGHIRASKRLGTYGYVASEGLELCGGPVHPQSVGWIDIGHGWTSTINLSP